VRGAIVRHPLNWPEFADALAAIRRRIVDAPGMWKKARNDSGLVSAFELGAAMRAGATPPMITSDLALATDPRSSTASSADRRS
jgi:hypothetical protein